MKEALFIAIDPISEITYEALGTSFVRRGVIDGYTIVRNSTLNGSWRGVIGEVIRRPRLAKEISSATILLLIGCLRYLANQDYAFESFASARIYGVRIGDSILGCALRSNSEERISFCKSVIWVFKEAIKTAVACRTLIDICQYKFIGVWEQNYLLRHLCRRVCLTYGVSLMQFNNYPDKLRFYSSTGELTYEDELKETGILGYAKGELDVADKFMSERTQDISRIGYMDRIRNSEAVGFQILLDIDSGDIFNEKLQNWKRSRQDIVVIYSHSYSSALSLSGFCDLAPFASETGGVASGTWWVAFCPCGGGDSCSTRR